MPDPFYILLAFVSAVFGAIVGGVAVFLANLAYAERKIRRTLKEEFSVAERLW